MTYCGSLQTAVIGHNFFLFLPFGGFKTTVGYKETYSGGFKTVGIISIRYEEAYSGSIKTTIIDHLKNKIKIILPSS